MNESGQVWSQDFNMQENEYDDEKQDKKQKIVRNEFVTVGKYNIPLVKKQNIDINKIELWGYAKVTPNDKENRNKTIYFFTYDWLFENVYSKPETVDKKITNTKYNCVGKFITKFNVENSQDTSLEFILTGDGGKTFSQEFSLVNI